VWDTESIVKAVKAVRDKKMDLTEGLKNVQCTESNTERHWYGFSQHSVSSVDISSQRTKEERNGCAALNVTNGAMRSTQANVKTGLGSPEVTGSSRVIYTTVLSNFIFQFGQTCYYCYSFLVQTVVFFLYYEVLLMFPSYVFSPLYVTFSHYYNETCFKML
jgi:hypothetical protein